MIFVSYLFNEKLCDAVMVLYLGRPWVVSSFLAEVKRMIFFGFYCLLFVFNGVGGSGASSNIF